ncbi:MAG: sugar-binding protein [Eubacteriales bacterium]
MKKFFSAILAGVVLASLAASVSASEDGACKGVVPKVPDGQITVDGEMNEQVWTEALQVSIDLLNIGSEDGAQGVAYMLWAEGSWYLFVEVKDADVVAPDQDIQQTAPWNTDSVEMFFDFGNKHEDLTQQFRVDCSGWQSYYTEGGATSAYGPDAEPYFDDSAVKMTGTGYNIEMRINLDKYGLKEGDSIGLQLQINDVTTDSPTACANVYNMASSNDAKSWDVDLYDYITLGAELEVPEEPAAEEPTDAPVEDAPVAPTTADAGIVAAAAVMAVAAGVVLSKKH